MNGRTQPRVGWARTPVWIENSELVVDVGSGAYPNRRADVLCERSLERSGRPDAVVDRPTVVADVQAIPFRTQSVGFVVVSHLLEHIEDPESACAELSRVARRGYIETPGACWEWLFPEADHRWYVSKRSDTLCFRRTDRRRPVGLVRRSLYSMYYSGVRDELRGDEPRFGRALRRAAGWLSYVVRGVANRSGLAVTRVVFDSSRPLTIRVRRPR